jgi:hypothetical protein
MQNLLNVLERQIDELHGELAYADMLLRELHEAPLCANVPRAVAITERVRFLVEIEKMRDTLEAELARRLAARDEVEAIAARGRHHN